DHCNGGCPPIAQGLDVPAQSGREAGDSHWGGGAGDDPFYKNFTKGVPKAGIGGLSICSPSGGPKLIVEAFFDSGEVALVFTVLDGLPFVIELFALGQTDVDLGQPPVVYKEVQGN